MTFLTPIFLAAAAAAAIPIVLHFVRRMNTKRVQFSSLMFLSATPKQVVRKRRLRDVLLMSLRAAMLLLLALVFARPFLPPDLVPFVSRAENESVVILVDDSFSMRAGDAFEQAKSEALRRIESAAPDDEVAVITFSDAPRQLTDLTRDKDAAAAALRSIEAPGYRTTSFHEPLRLADDLLRNARHEQRRVVLISDLQNNGWSGSADNWKLAPGVIFDPVNVGASTAANRFVEDIAVTRRGAVGDDNGVALRIDARVATDDVDGEASAANATSGNTSAAGSASAAGDASATLAIDGLRPESATIPGGSGRATFQQQIDNAGLFRGSITLPDDALAEDNTHYVAFAVDTRPAVLSVDGSTRSRFGQSFFLQRAFAVGANRLYDFADGNSGRIAPRSLADQSAVFIENVSSLPSRARADLIAFVEDGGTAVVSFGDRFGPNDYGALLRESGVGELGSVVTPSSVQGEDAIIGDVEWRHPMFSRLAGIAGGILRPKFRRYVRVTPDSSASVLASFDSGDPWIIERKIGQGSLLVTTSTLGADWTNLPIDELFVPLVYEIAGYAVELQRERMNYTVGEPVVFTGRPGDRWDIRAPNGNVSVVELRDTGSGGRGLFAATDLPGHYTANSGTRRFAFAVNVDPAESVLARRDAEQVYASVVPSTADLPEQPRTEAQLLRDEETDQKLWRFVLLAVIALFLAESILSHRRKRVRTTTGDVA
ncbi:MAG: VWA domain-containing protein [Rhodothermales bacterium]